MVDNIERDSMDQADSRKILLECFQQSFGVDFELNRLWLERLVEAYDGPHLLNPGDFLWDMGDTRNDYYFILEGLVSEYWINDFGESFIYAFIGSQEFCVNEFQMLFGAPSKSRLQVIQPTWVMVLRQEKESEFRNGNTPWEQLSYEVGKRILEKRRERIRWLSGAKEEHLRQVITNYPGLLNHATKEQIARYLGVSRATAYRLLTNLARK